jgi:hypothetical protein
MSDLKEFLEKEQVVVEGDCCYLKDDYDKLAKLQPEDLFYSPALVIQKKKLGLFFWERGGKRFVQKLIELNFEITLFNCNAMAGTSVVNYKGQDFLDCLACLGEDKVKELIEKEGV